jgi:hypothetical protein
MESEKAWETGLFLFEHVTECYYLSPETGPFLEDFFERSNTPLGRLAFRYPRELGASTCVSLRATPSIFNVNKSMRVQEAVFA